MSMLALLLNLDRHDVCLLDQRQICLVKLNRIFHLRDYIIMKHIDRLLSLTLISDQNEPNLNLNCLNISLYLNDS
jgi:hypothetical protein